MRLFVALDFPETIRDSIRDLITKLKPLCKDARWARVEGMHVTLKFIGYIDDKELDPIINALESVKSSEPVDMRFRGVGFFPNERRPRVMWCGIEPSPNLAPLAKTIETALVPLGIAAEKRDYIPHLTLARFESPRGTEKLVAATAEMESLDLGATREARFHLFESVLQRSGAEYKKLKSFCFAKDAA